MKKNRRIVFSGLKYRAYIYIYSTIVLLKIINVFIDFRFDEDVDDQYGILTAIRSDVMYYHQYKVINFSDVYAGYDIVTLRHLI